MTEEDLLLGLHKHDMLIAECARGDLDFVSFLAQYEDFYPHWALDGHEADGQELRLLARHAGRIDVHRRVWDEVITQLCSDDDAEKPDYRKAGRIGSHEGERRLRAIAEDAGLCDMQAG